MDWKGILAIISTVFAILGYFGITPAKLARYASQPKRAVSSKPHEKQKALQHAIILSAVLPISIWLLLHFSTDTNYLSTFVIVMVLILGIAQLWFYTAIFVWQPSEERRKKLLRGNLVGIIAWFVVVAVLVAPENPHIIPAGVGGFFGGMGISKLKNYLASRKRISNEKTD